MVCPIQLTWVHSNAKVHETIVKASCLVGWCGGFLYKYMWTVLCQVCVLCSVARNDSLGSGREEAWILHLGTCDSPWQITFFKCRCKHISKSFLQRAKSRRWHLRSTNVKYIPRSFELFFYHRHQYIFNQLKFILRCWSTGSRMVKWHHMILTSPASSSETSLSLETKALKHRHHHSVAQKLWTKTALVARYSA